MSDRRYKHGGVRDTKQERLTLSANQCDLMNMQKIGSGDNIKIDYTETKRAREH